MYFYDLGFGDLNVLAQLNFSGPWEILTKLWQYLFLWLN